MLRLQVHTRVGCKSDPGRASPGTGRRKNAQKGCLMQLCYTGCYGHRTGPNLNAGHPTEESS